MADFESTTSRRDALMIKRLGASGAFVPNIGSRIDDINVIIEPGVNIDGDFGESDVPQTLATIYKPAVVKIAVGDQIEKGQSTYKVRRVLQDDGQVATCVVV
jgi:hypothetical protein